MDKEINQRFLNVRNSKTFNRIICLLELNNKKVFDIGCGFGEYLALFGEGSFGITSTEKEVIGAKERGLDVFVANAELINKDNIKRDFDIVWANNIFEHLLSPHYFLMRLRSVSNNGVTLVLGVPVIPKIVSLINFSAFRGPLASNHINFFTKETLKITVERSGWRVIETRPYLSKFRLLDNVLSFFSPHIYIVAQKDPLFKYPEKKLLEWEGESYYEDILGLTK